MSIEQGTVNVDVVDSIQLKLDKQARRKDLLTRILPFVGVIFIFLFFLITTNGKIISASNLSNLVEDCFTITIVALGASFVFASGQMDIAAGSVMAVSEILMALMMRAGGFPVFIILGGMAVTLAFYFVLASIVAYLRVPSFIVSLSIMNIGSGILATVASTSEITIPYMKYNYINDIVVKLTALIVMGVIMILIFNKTRIGRDLKALGGNEVAAQQSGVNRKSATIIGFLLLGVCAGVAGFFNLGRTGVVSGATGQGLGLNVMVAIVLGGFPLTGGANSRIIGAVIGALTVTILTDGMQLLSLDSTVSLLIRGVLFLIIVGISYERTKGKIVT